MPSRSTGRSPAPLVIEHLFALWKKDRTTTRSTGTYGNFLQVARGDVGQTNAGRPRSAGGRKSASSGFVAASLERKMRSSGFPAASLERKMRSSGFPGAQIIVEWIRQSSTRGLFALPIVHSRHFCAPTPRPIVHSRHFCAPAPRSVVHSSHFCAPGRRQRIRSTVKRGQAQASRTALSTGRCQLTGRRTSTVAAIGTITALTVTALATAAATAVTAAPLRLVAPIGTLCRSGRMLLGVLLL